MNLPQQTNISFYIHSVNVIPAPALAGVNLYLRKLKAETYSFFRSIMSFVIGTASNPLGVRTFT